MVKMVEEIGGYYTLPGAAKALDKSFWQVQNYVRRKKVPCIRVGKSLLVRLADLNGLQ